MSVRRHPVANAEVPEDITAYGKSLGQIGHRTLTDGEDLVVIDEWSDGEAFNKFFAGATRMAEFLSGAGIVGEPEYRSWMLWTCPARSDRSTLVWNVPCP